MSETLSLSGIEYIPAKLAGKRFGYTGDYIAKLARDGQVMGTKVGHQWFVVEASVKELIENKSIEKQKRNDAIRMMRQRELSEFQKKITPASKQVNLVSGRRMAVIETLVILIIGLSVGVSGYVMTAPNTQTASIASSSYSVIERLAVSFYSFITGGDGEVVTDAADASLAPVPAAEVESPSGIAYSTMGTTTLTSLVIAPNEVFTATTVESVRESFSDDVSVSVDPEHPDTGIIIPHFRDRDGEQYRFLMVPVTGNQNGG